MEFGITVGPPRRRGLPAPSQITNYTRVTVNPPLSPAPFIYSSPFLLLSRAERIGDW